MHRFEIFISFACILLVLKMRAGRLFQGACCKIPCRSHPHFNEVEVGGQKLQGGFCEIGIGRAPHEKSSFFGHACQAQKGKIGHRLLIDVEHDADTCFGPGLFDQEALLCYLLEGAMDGREMMGQDIRNASVAVEIAAYRAQLEKFSPRMEMDHGRGFDGGVHG